LRGEAGVWDRESGDRIKGCDGACIHAVGSLAGADSWSITKVAAFSIFWRSIFSDLPEAPQTRAVLEPQFLTDFNSDCA
jgi:hypothetical protein